MEWIFLALTACTTTERTSPADESPVLLSGPALPLVVDDEVALDVNPVGFDYQAVDAALGHLVIGHSDDGSVDIVDLADGALLAEIPGIPLARGVAVADDVGRIFVTSSPSSLVLIDNASFAEVGRVTTGTSPDGVAWDPVDQVVGVSDQGDGALSLLAGGGTGARTQIPLGQATGNVVYDRTRGWFWITAVAVTGPDQLVGVIPTDGTIVASLDLPGCTGAHGLRLHPDAASAFVACEDNDAFLRVDLTSGDVSTGKTGHTPDVLAIDPTLGWLYVAAESGDLAVFDISRPGVALVGHDSPGAGSHTIAVDTATHRVFFPLDSGPKGTAVLRILQPAGI